MKYKAENPNTTPVISDPLYLDIVECKGGETLVAAFTEAEVRRAVVRGMKLNAYRRYIINSLNKK